MMTSKERMMVALEGGKPDRLPVTIHQWQSYQLREHCGGLDQLEAFIACGLDASLSPFEVMQTKPSPNWLTTTVDLGEKDGETLQRHTVTTPEGDLTWTTAANAYTRFKTSYPIKNERDAELAFKYCPGITFDREKLNAWYERTGDHGIVRGTILNLGQAGPWQDLCEMVGTEDAIFWAIDTPELVHHLLDELTKMKVKSIHEEMQGLKFDIVETGGGAGSANVISPSMFAEFCVPYDRRVHEALHDVGLTVTYHTCGGMMPILDLIPENACDTSETLSPPGVGGDITLTDRDEVKRRLGSKVSLIGGIDQHGLLEIGTKQQIEADVRSCFESFGKDGGYICSASDHFFDAPMENLRAFAAAAAECVY